MGRKEYEKVTAMQSNPSENVRMISAILSSVIAVGGYERINIYAPTGKIAKMINMQIDFPPVAAATSGAKNLTIDLDAGGGLATGTCAVSAPYTDSTGIALGRASGTSITPPNETAFQAQISKITFDEFVALSIVFENATNAPTAENRNYRVFISETKIS